MQKAHLKIFAVIACMAVVAPAGAVAKRGEKGGKGKAPKAKLVSANVKGIVTGHDAGTLAVAVKKASGQAKACKGRELTFDVSNARFRTPDHNADGKKDAADVVVGNAVKVKGKVAVKKGRKTTCAEADGPVLPAKRVENRTKLDKPKSGDEQTDETHEDDLADEDEMAEEDELFEDELDLEGEDSVVSDDDSFEDDETFDDSDYLDEDSDLGDDEAEDDV